MQGADAFLTLAEFSIALASFTSVVVVFANRGGEFSSMDRFRVQGALWSSLGPAVLAFAPIAFDLFGLSETGHMTCVKRLVLRLSDCASWFANSESGVTYSRRPSDSRQWLHSS